MCFGSALPAPEKSDPAVQDTWTMVTTNQAVHSATWTVKLYFNK